MKFDSKPIEEHSEVPLADEGQFEQLVGVWQRRAQSMEEGRPSSYVVLVARNKEPFPVARQEELLSLVRAQGDWIAGHEVHRLLRPDARALFRRGAAAEIADRAIACGADQLIVDAQLSPSQSRNLEDSTGLAVRDREAVILNVFQKHVKTRKARIQVEIAHLEYLRPRIRGLGLEMDQQAGGVVGSRGPGETASELLARQLDGRLHLLRKAFKAIAKEGNVQRKRRLECKKISLVGYTNAGKTSLMNALTQAGLSAANRPFETLDTTSRSLSRHGGDILISDTVGFIRDLPSRLFASFESTLAEIQESALLAMVVDISDEENGLHLRTTEDMLKKLDVDSLPRFYIFTKIDRLVVLPSRDQLATCSHGFPYMLLNSNDPTSIAKLRQALLLAVRKQQQCIEIDIAYDAIEATALVYSTSRIIAAEPTAQGMRFTIEASPQRISAIQKALRGVVRC